LYVVIFLFWLSNKRFYSPEKKREKNKRRKRNERKKKKKRKGKRKGLFFVFLF
jgi:hypothetical protein